MRRKRYRPTKKSRKIMFRRGYLFLEDRLLNGIQGFAMSELSAAVFERPTTPKDDDYVRQSLFVKFMERLDYDHSVIPEYNPFTSLWGFSENADGEFYRSVNGGARILQSPRMKRKIAFIERHRKKHKELIENVLPQLKQITENPLINK